LGGGVGVVRDSHMASKKINHKQTLSKTSTGFREAARDKRRTKQSSNLCLVSKGKHGKTSTMFRGLRKGWGQDKLMAMKSHFLEKNSVREEGHCCKPGPLLN